MNDAAVRRRFLSPELDLSDWSQLQPYYDQLQQRPLDSAQALQRWLEDFSELTAAMNEHGARRRIAYACHTDDPEIERAFMHFVEQIAPQVRVASFHLKQKFIGAEHLTALPPQTYDVLIREWGAEVELFRTENVPLQTELTKLSSRYDKRIGAMQVTYEGGQWTLQQIARFLEQPDRAVRETTWRLAADRRLEDREAIDALFDEQRALRQRIAHNADKTDYREYCWQDYARFDYTPDHCLAFADAVEQLCVPLVEQLDAERREALGVNALRPWDLAVDVQGRPPLQPFDPAAPQTLIDRAAEVFQRLSPDLHAEFTKLKLGRNLDLESRPGKRAGGFQAALEESGQPFIFMNAAGAHRDVETILHEAGHAFHFRFSWQRAPVVFVRHAPLEFCEVASMAMELMAADHLDVFYPDPQDRGRAWRTMLEGIVRVLPWIAQIDAFQHWIYTNPDHTADERKHHWLALMDRFGSSVIDWSGLEATRESLWHRQLHLFHRPFYYIEYGIAQLGALQLWTRFRHAPAETLADYRHALALGNTRPLPELFHTAGLRFAFDAPTMQPLIESLAEELAAV